MAFSMVSREGASAASVWPAETCPAQGLAFADLRLDPSARSLHREGKSVQLSPKEFELLRLLMGRAGAVCPKGEILDRLWGGAEDNNLEAYISFLRKKFFYLGSRASIATLRKVGYRLDDPGKAE